MFFFDFIFLNLNFFCLFFLFILFYLFLNIIKNNTNQSFIFWNSLLLTILCVTLSFFGIELFSSILFLSEIIVFFYIYVTNLLKSDKLSRNNFPLNLFILTLILVLCLPCYKSFYNYSLLNWYNTNLSLNNDVFGIYYYYYCYNWFLLIYIGLLLCFCTYLLCIFCILIQSSDFNLKRGKKNNFFFQKKQDKSHQNSKKPFLFKNIFFGDW